MSEVSDDDWKNFATRAEGRDPDATVSRRDHERALARTVAAADAVAAQPEASVSPTLPRIEVGEPGMPTSAGDDFEVIGVLGEGGMGKVLLARQRSLGREVAVKIVKADVGKSATLGALFEEARITGELEHPNVVPVHALGQDVAGRPVLVMKRIDGISWKTLAANPDHPRREDLGRDVTEAHVEVAMAAANALHFAHSRGFVHRDVKLDNVMIGSFGEVYVVDWGIAIKAPIVGKKTQTVGTPSYMAPELVVGDLGKTDARTDVYLLGATLHHALVGSARHAGENVYAALQAAHASEPFDYAAQIPAELAAILNRAMHRDPAARFETALAMRRSLAEFLRHRGSIAVSDEARERLRVLETSKTSHGAIDERRIQALITECRFGFAQALKAWPENEAASAGLQATLEIAVGHELERRDVERAEALLLELPQARPELAELVARLEVEMRAEAGETERLRADAREHDLRVGGGAQLAILSVLPALFVFAAAYVFSRGRVLKAPEIIGMPVLAFVLLGAAIFFGRRRLTTTISRRALLAVVLVPFAAVAHRIVALHFGDEFASLAATDLVFIAMAAILIGLSFLPRVAWAAVPLVVGAIVTMVRADLALPVFAAAVASAFATLLLMWRRSVDVAPAKR